MSSVAKPADDPLELQAEELAHASRIDELQPSRPDILQHLDAVRAWFDETLLLCREPPAGFEIAARWILDNDYQVVRALRHIDKDLPVNYFKQLPRLVDPAYEYMPQAYQLVHILLKETRLQLTYDRLIQFVSAYQRHAVLAEAELWAIPALLRIACLENLVCGSNQLLGEAFLPFDSNHIIDECSCLDATERVSGAVASFGLIDQVDWHDFVIEMSHIEASLLSDPANIYVSMSRSSRNVYRREVEALARHSPYSEVAVANQLIALADQQADDRTRHIGYWLFSSGRAHLDSKLQYRQTFRDRYHACRSRFSGFLYVFMLTAVTIAALLVPLLYLRFVETGLLLSIVISVLSLAPASDIAVQLVHGWATRFVPRRELLALDRHAVLSDDCQCAVVVPVIVYSAREVDRIIEKLELRYLANTEKYLRFVLLSDLADASEERIPADNEIELKLVTGIRGLNDRYRYHALNSSSAAKAVGTDRFLLLHRSRQFNPAEGCWMGWERKRGKLQQFNTLLVDGWNDVFNLIEGDIDQLSGLKYVISLDADTMLPPGTAADLVCTFEHPLNQPTMDADTGKLSAGYSLLQPRIESLDMRESSSRFSHLFAGDSAIDIYSHAVSDFHQDWFGTGSYVGKGIYHVKSFHQSTLGRVPENRILSHDLFEGMHGRVALASSIVLYESFPETWAEHGARRHRWIRGDWQLLPWLGRLVPGGSQVPIDSGFQHAGPLEASG